MKVIIGKDEWYPVFDILKYEGLTEDDYKLCCEINDELLQRYLRVRSEWTEVQYELRNIFKERGQ